MAVSIERSSYVSPSADEAWDALSRMYTRARPHAASPDASIRFDTTATTDLAIDRGFLHTAQGAFDASPDQLNVISVLGGAISLDFGRRGAISNVAGDSYLYLPDGAADLQWDRFEALALRVPMRLVAQAAAELTGLDAGALRFTSPRPVSTPSSQLWRRTVEMLWDQLNVPDTASVPVPIHHELLTVTASVALTAFPNTAMSRGYVPGPGDVRPAAVHRAVAYTDAHLSLPITTTDIAEAAGTSPRAIRTAFQQHLDTSLTDYLRRARLEAAHRDLATADFSDPLAVPIIAARWGFTSPDELRAAHLHTYGAPLGD